MDTAIIIFCVLGALMFAAYVFFIIKTAHDDEKIRKGEKLKSNGNAKF